MIGNQQMDKDDKDDLKSVLNEQMDYIRRLIEYIHKHKSTEILELCNNSLSLLSDIDECNMVMMEIVEGPKGTIKRLV